jgi:hypothetical protein
LDIVALTDHNSTLNCPAFAEACSREGLRCLFGVEACSREEVHILFIFGVLDAAMDFGEWLQGFIPDLPYDAEKLGEQVVVDVDENILDMPGYWLGSALDLGFEELCTKGAARSALVIPAHVDRPMFSVSSQLGFLPKGPYAAVESMREPARALSRGHTVISGSDAHVPEHVGRRPFRAHIELAGPDCAGDALLAALGEALKAGQVQPAWQLARGQDGSWLRSQP